MEIDLLSASSFAHGQPHDQYRWLRANDPCHFHPEPSGPGFWALTRYDDVRSIGRNAATFSSWPTMTIADVPGGGEHQMMISCDPPAHTAQRRLLNSRFTPRAVTSWRDRIEELAVQIVDAVAERGECDLVADLAGEMPSFVIAELLGIPLEDGRRLYQLTEILHAAPGTHTPDAVQSALGEMFSYGQRVAEEKRRHESDDLSSLLVRSELRGKEAILHSRLARCPVHLAFHFCDIAFEKGNSISIHVKAVRIGPALDSIPVHSLCLVQVIQEGVVADEVA